MSNGVYKVRKIVSMSKVVNTAKGSETRIIVFRCPEPEKLDPQFCNPLKLEVEFFKKARYVYETYWHVRFYSWSKAKKDFELKHAETCTLEIWKVEQTINECFYLFADF